VSGHPGHPLDLPLTKFEVSRGFTLYEAINGGAKCRKWGGLGG